jgi:hypothetical protein
VEAVLGHLEPPYRLVGLLLYGCGLRLPVILQFDKRRRFTGLAIFKPQNKLARLPAMPISSGSSTSRPRR